MLVVPISARVGADEHALDEIIQLDVMAERARNVGQTRVPMRQEAFGLNLPVPDVLHGLPVNSGCPVSVETAQVAVARVPSSRKSWLS